MTGVFGTLERIMPTTIKDFSGKWIEARDTLRAQVAMLDRDSDSPDQALTPTQLHDLRKQLDLMAKRLDLLLLDYALLLR